MEWDLVKEIKKGKSVYALPGIIFAESSWGYGKDAQTEEDYFIRLEALTDAILSFDHIVGYCYTQLTDVEQEQNGVYNYDRSEKFDSRKFYRIFSKTKELE